jgi:hypothetical protein
MGHAISLAQHLGAEGGGERVKVHGGMIAVPRDGRPYMPKADVSVRRETSSR